MAQQHLDRLTAVDTSFLLQEGRASHMHIGGVLVFDGPAPDYGDFLRHVQSRLDRVPRYRQKLAAPPLDLGRPRWIDDADFNLEYHVRHTALPTPGTEHQLLRLAGRIASQQLDRGRPLWECWLVEGLEPAEGSDTERFAILAKNHHSLVDGISGVDLASVLFDLTPEIEPPAEAALEPWRPEPEPSQVELLASSALGAVLTGAELARRAIRAALTPEPALQTLRDTVEGLGEIVWAALNPAPQTPLNVEIGPHRRFTVVRQQLHDYKLVKNSFGGTINDVVLTVVSGALRRWLLGRGIRTEGVELRALVPVSVRTPDERGALGNRLTALRGPLPVYVEDPVARLAVVREAMDGLKASKQALGAASLSAVNELAPPAILAQASRLQFSTRLFNLLVTNIPGPQFPLWVLGRRLRDVYPLAFLPENHALAVAILSYDGRIEYGLLGDYDAMSDIEVVAEGIERELHALCRAAEERSERGRVPTGEPEERSAAILAPPVGRSARGPAADMRARRRREAPGNGHPDS
jgi:diacylglycerol O-acyltransferase